jgi:hypothetical protein
MKRLFAGHLNLFESVDLVHFVADVDCDLEAELLRVYEIEHESKLDPDLICCIAPFTEAYDYSAKKRYSIRIRKIN